MCAGRMTSDVSRCDVDVSNADESSYLLLLHLGGDVEDLEETLEEILHDGVAEERDVALQQLREKRRLQCAVEDEPPARIGTH